MSGTTNIQLPLIPFDHVGHAIALIRQHEPPEGYYVAFSGGKDSCVIKQLCIEAGVKFEAWYSNTTIDPPELVRFIREHHPDVKWNNPEIPMMRRVVEKSSAPTRHGRWCCEEYKERFDEYDAGRFLMLGVRVAESPRRAGLWTEYTDGVPILSPIVFWSTREVWGFIRSRGLPYCPLYDEGFERLGCVGCPLADPAQQRREFDRWPAYERNWKRAIMAQWERWVNVPTKQGKPRTFLQKFRNAEEYWLWWTTQRAPNRVDCQSDLLWTNL